MFGDRIDFGSQGDLLEWMRAHEIRVVANYVNRVGRTVCQITQECALRRALSTRVSSIATVNSARAEQTRRVLRSFVHAEVAAGRLAVTPPARTPSMSQTAKILCLIAIPMIGLIALPVIIALLPFVLLTLCNRERNDPENFPSPDLQALRVRRQLEDRDVTNQFSSLGSVKLGFLRRWLVSLVLVLTKDASRHVFTRGHLGSVLTIHFARWVPIDNECQQLPWRPRGVHGRLRRDRNFTRGGSTIRRAYGHLSMPAALSSSKSSSRTNTWNTARRNASVNRDVSCAGHDTNVPSGRKRPSVTSRCRCGCQLAREPCFSRRATMPTARSRSPVSARMAVVTVRPATRALSPSGTGHSCVQASQRMRANPCSRTPRARNVSATYPTTGRHGPFSRAQQSS